MIAKKIRCSIVVRMLLPIFGEVEKCYISFYVEDIYFLNCTLKTPKAFFKLKIGIMY